MTLKSAKKKSLEAYKHVHKGNIISYVIKFKTGVLHLVSGCDVIHVLGQLLNKVLDYLRA